MSIIVACIVLSLDETKDVLDGETYYAFLVGLSGSCHGVGFT